ncbi:hypothetical protein Plhal304r1_c027g0090231 [Plasmopara halstedii]
MKETRPYELPHARYNMVIGTDQTFTKTPPRKIMVSLAGKRHGNEAIDQLFVEFAIGGILHVKQVPHRHRKCQLGHQHGHDPPLLVIIGCKPVYDTFCRVYLVTRIMSATWRIYLLTSTCPSALMVDASVCDKILFDNKLHPAHGKNTVEVTKRLLSVWGPPTPH